MGCVRAVGACVYALLQALIHSGSQAYIFGQFSMCPISEHLMEMESWQRDVLIQCIWNIYYLFYFLGVQV